MKTELVHTFTEDERRVARAARERYLHTLQVIAELHRIEGTFSVAPDDSGFMKIEPFAPMAANAPGK